ncbi:hypothetical protein [Rhodoferax sp. TS-BS-61-7]|nr:hypothetical protein [Rhodoferax sp. TS-BS-61-7]
MTATTSPPAAPLPWPTQERLDYLFRHVAQDPGAQVLKALLQDLLTPAQP